VLWEGGVGRQSARVGCCANEVEGVCQCAQQTRGMTWNDRTGVNKLSSGASVNVFGSL